MTLLDSNGRGPADQLSKHIFFWDAHKKLKMLQEVSDKLEYVSTEQQQLI